MDMKFHMGLFEGDCVNGFKLSMGITGGDFWARIGGCKNIYRSDLGETTEDIDFSKVLAVCDIDSNSVELSGMVHEKGKSYLYAVRSANCAGFEEQGLGGLEKVSFDSDGTIIGKSCNQVSDLNIDQVGSNTVRIVWRYCPINQQAECMGFNIYSDDGCGDIDYSESIGKVEYDRQRSYSLTVEVTEPAKWRFCVGAVSSAGIERMSSEISLDIVTGSICDPGDIQVQVL